MPRRPHAVTRNLAALGIGALSLYSARVLLDFFGPALPYSMPQGVDCPLDSPEFIQFLSLITDGTLRRSRITRVRNGDEFYPAQLEAIRRAQHSINLEFYEFHEGRVGQLFIDALSERARAGVEVRVVVDAIGSFSTRASFFDPLRAAGGHMRWYHPLRWDTWPKANNRTHRKLLIVDGETGFIGGAGIADHWFYPTKKGPAGRARQPAASRNKEIPTWRECQPAASGDGSIPAWRERQPTASRDSNMPAWRERQPTAARNKEIPPWRDTFFCVEGEAVAGLISTFSENWLESSGEILSGHAQFAFRSLPEGATSFIVASTPHGGGTQARILFQALIKSACRSIRITTPYFLPDRSARHALVEAVGRGVDVQILTAGPHIDHPSVREISRHSSRHLLQAGAAIYEYQPAMIHAKLMTVDGLWSVAGSTNFDHRSFALNDEVNLAVLDPALAGVLDGDFADDLRQSRPLTLRQLGQRGPLAGVERVLDHVVKAES